MSISFLTKPFVFLVLVSFLAEPAEARIRCIVLSGLCKAACEGDFEGIASQVKGSSSDDQVCALGLSPNSDVVHALVRNGVNVSVKKERWNTNSPPGRTGLYRSIFQNNRETFDAMLAEGVEINSQDRNGVSPLIYAAMLGRLDMVVELYNRGADIHAQDRRARNAACLATHYLFGTHQREIVARLEQWGAPCQL